MNGLQLLCLLAIALLIGTGTLGLFACLLSSMISREEETWNP